MHLNALRNIYRTRVWTNRDSTGVQTDQERPVIQTGSYWNVVLTYIKYPTRVWDKIKTGERERDKWKLLLSRITPLVLILCRNRVAKKDL